MIAEEEDIEHSLQPDEDDGLEQLAAFFAEQLVLEQRFKVVAARGHAFTEGLAPYAAVENFLWDPLHADNNIGQSTAIEQYYALAEDMDVFFAGDVQPAPNIYLSLIHI